jgi:hypothetical protein
MKSPARAILPAVIVILLVAAHAGTAGADLVANGTFGGTGKPDTSGWSFSKDVSATSGQSGMIPPYSSLNVYDYAYFTGTNNGHRGTVAQTLGTVAGQSYTFVFWLAQNNSAAVARPAPSRISVPRVRNNNPCDRKEKAEKGADEAPAADQIFSQPMFPSK